MLCQPCCDLLAVLWVQNRRWLHNITVPETVFLGMASGCRAEWKTLKGLWASSKRGVTVWQPGSFCSGMLLWDLPGPGSFPLPPKGLAAP